MSGMFWILVGGIAGWFTGTFMGEQGYGKRLLGGYARSLDVVLGIVGVSGLSSGKAARSADMPPRFSAL